MWVPKSNQLYLDPITISVRWQYADQIKFSFILYFAVLHSVLKSKKRKEKKTKKRKEKAPENRPAGLSSWCIVAHE